MFRMTSASHDDPSDQSPRSWLLGMRRGATGHCPNCGAGRAFAGYLAISRTCANCNHALGAYRADDAPPYFTIFAVGHIIVPLMLLLERSAAPAMWIHMAIWLPLTLALSLLLLRPIKGAVLGVMWATRAEGQA